MAGIRQRLRVARAEATAGTAERILDAAVEVFWELPTDQISLDEVARRAGVSVQTVIRRFGGRDGLLAAAGERESERVRRQRDEAAVGDPAGSVRVLVEHYEVTGDRVLKMLTEEDHIPALRAIVDRGRVLHRDWCARVFAPALTGLHGLERERRFAQFVAVCDDRPHILWRGWMGIEPTRDGSAPPLNGFEDRGRHQPPNIPTGLVGYRARATVPGGVAEDTWPTPKPRPGPGASA